MRIFSAAAVLLSATAAFAQEAKEDPFAEVQYGQRVEIIFRSDIGVLGKLIPYTDPRTQEEVELSKTGIILLDTSLEYPEMGGAKDPLSGKFLPCIVGFERILVKSVRRLPDLTAEEVAQREKAREEALARMLAEEVERRKLEAQREERRKKEMEDAAASEKEAESKTLEGELRQKAERLAKAREVYAKFPPAAGWGGDKLTEIEGKNVRHQPLTAEEQDFIANYELWVWYKLYIEEKESQKKETPPEKPKVEEPKTEEPKTEKPE